MLDYAYAAALHGLLVHTASILPDGEIVVCGVARKNRDTFLVWLAPGGSLVRRYAIQFPLEFDRGVLTTKVHVVELIRGLEALRAVDPGAIDELRLDSPALGAPVVEARAVAYTSSGAHARWVDGLAAGVWSMGTAHSVQPRDVAMVGFVQSGPELTRFYIHGELLPSTVAVDVPIFASADLRGEILSLFRDGLPSSLAGSERDPDQFSQVRYDMRDWFAHSSSSI
ncbi:hypothetical protein PSA01_47800 [Pseudonocardia saturnea]|uniref:Uncharacterized protein n=1 Tax=Pseudonocardia saturnea TaxID=33909 RepID=A0ABQ0S4E0_9PSEU|nr:hypothetical protein Pdca_52050 [Pseudonocardia autotrophica]GEC27751.1 hypothetical protein PSA01_47800 [Pseudonocardia saturnea]